MFSNALKLSDLDDFLLPAQECIKPLIDSLNGGKEDGPAAKIVTADEKVFGFDQIQPQLITLRKGAKGDRDPDSSTIFASNTPQTKRATAQVSLYDCLACSGCVTTAEAVLIQQQGVDEFLEKAKSYPITVVSISTASLCSLAFHYGTTLSSTLKKLSALFRSFGATYVLESSISEACCLVEAYEEFITSYRAIASANHSRDANDKLESFGASTVALPIFASHCPGWVCYAEKVLPLSTLNHVSRVRSSQQIQGSLVKTLLLERHNCGKFIQSYRSHTIARSSAWQGCRAFSLRSCETATRQDVFHVCIMPCYDKKLEATRPEFSKPNSPGESAKASPDVDTVLSTLEILDLLEKSGRCFSDWPEDSVDQIDLTDGLDDKLMVAVESNFGSGGFLEYIFRRAKEELCGKEVHGSLEYIDGVNKDMKEVSLNVSGAMNLKFVRAYGFRNIQNIIRRLNSVKREPEFHYVEVMACPGGCLNGGAQLKPNPTSNGNAKSQLRQLELTLRSKEATELVPPTTHPKMSVVQDFLQSESSLAFKTTYKTFQAKEGLNSSFKW